MVRDYTRKIHYKVNGKPLCGAHLAEGTPLDEEITKVTCKNCIAVNAANERIKNEYPWIEVRKDKVIHHVDKNTSIIETVSISDDGIYELAGRIVDDLNG